MTEKNKKQGSFGTAFTIGNSLEFGNELGFGKKVGDRISRTSPPAGSAIPPVQKESNRT